jgi:4,5-DOPA dioxygenase extradiol
MTVTDPVALVRGVQESFAKTDTMPVLFVGHGNPMNAIEDNDYTKGWKKIAASLPKPQAILAISAHWETYGTQVTAIDNPKTIHDFSGFPQELFDVQYPAPGSMQLAVETKKSITKTTVGLDSKWGLDHGTWSVLLPMYPKADIPVIQLSLDASRPPEYHYELAKELSALRDRGILILGSGNIVHNLRKAVWGGKPYDWALEFDASVKKYIIDGDDKSLINYSKIPGGELSVPTNEHYLPMLYILALRRPKEQPVFYNEKIDLAAASMRSFILK